MKKILGLGSLFFVAALFFNAPAYSGEKEKCASEAAKAYTKLASNRLYFACLNDNNLLFKTDEHSCVLKAAEARTRSVANRLYFAYLNG